MLVSASCNETEWAPKVHSCWGVYLRWCASTSSGHTPKLVPGGGWQLADERTPVWSTPSTTSRMLEGSTWVAASKGSLPSFWSSKVDWTGSNLSLVVPVGSVCVMVGG